MKLDKQLLTTHAKRLQAILNEKSTFAPYIARPDFSKVLENALNTLNAAEKKLSTVQLASKLSAKVQVKEFNKLGKNTFKLDEKFKYDDEGDLIDNINYLLTYCNNIFKVNLDSLVEGKQVTASNPTIDLKPKPEVDENAGASFEGMGMGGFAGAGIYENPYIMGKAYADMKNDMASGKLYTYKTKPAIIPLIKKIAIGAMCALSVVLIVMAIFAFLSGNLAIQSLDKTQTGTLKTAAIGCGVMYILVALFGIYPIFATIKSITTKNDNLKYYFNWPWVLIFIIMVIVFVLMDLPRTWLLTSSCIITSSTSSSAYKAFQVWKIIYLVTLGVAALNLIPMIIGAVCNPKQDKALIEAKIKEYADKTMTSSGFGVPPTTPTGTDVQKPVEVKKTNTKKTDSKKDKSTTKDKK